MSLDAGQQVKLLLLHKVHRGRITERFCAYYDDGARVWYWATHAVRGLIVGRLVELSYPPDSPARRLEFVPRGLELCAKLGLTEADVTRRVVLTERGMREYKRLVDRAKSPTIAAAAAPGERSAEG